MFCAITGPSLPLSDPISMNQLHLFISGVVASFRTGRWKRIESVIEADHSLESFIQEF